MNVSWTVAAAIGGGLISVHLVAAALGIHTRLRGFLPEDWPGPSRKQHARPTPMVGAIPALVALAGAAMLDRVGTAVGMALLVAIGLFDDIAKDRGGRRRAAADDPAVAAVIDGVPWLAKLAVVLAACAAAMPDVTAARGAADVTLLDHALAFTLLFVVTNAINFLDNHNGVAVGIAAVALGFAAGPAAGLVAGTFVGFLPFNWPRSRAFLGDSGALPLGLACGSLALTDRAGAPLAAAALLAIPLADFTQVVIARLALGIPPWIGDRRHLTHLLHHGGCPAWALAPVFAAAAAGIALGLG